MFVGVIDEFQQTLRNAHHEITADSPGFMPVNDLGYAQRHHSNRSKENLQHYPNCC